MNLVHRIWDQAGPAGEARWQERLAWFRLLVLVHVAARAFLNLPADLVTNPIEAAVRGVLVAVALAGLVPGWARRATGAAVALVAVEIALSLPFVANHAMLELVLLFFLALLDESDEREGALLLRSLRVTLALLFFYTGLQKVLWGYWFDGQFLAYMAGTEERFSVFLQHFMPDAELARLHSYNLPGSWQPRPDAGPYRVDSWLFLALSNSIYLGEMVAGLGMLVPRVRVAAAGLALAMLVGIEAGARELTFGVLMTGGLLLFVPGAATRPAFAVAALVYAYLAGAHLGWLPMFEYVPA